MNQGQAFEANGLSLTIHLSGCNCLCCLLAKTSNSSFSIVHQNDDCLNRFVFRFRLALNKWALLVSASLFAWMAQTIRAWNSMIDNSHFANWSEIFSLPQFLLKTWPLTDALYRTALLQNTFEILPCFSFRRWGYVVFYTHCEVFRIMVLINLQTMLASQDFCNQLIVSWTEKSSNIFSANAD